MVRSIFLFLIKSYQYILSPLFKPCCRFHPTCSNYAYNAINHYGLSALPKVIYRILRCNPFGGYGYDPVPEKNIKNKNFKQRKQKNEKRR